MAIYEFVCLDCGDSFDKLVRSSFTISDVVCPACESPEIKKKLSVFSSKMSGSTAASASAASCAPGGL